MLAFKYRFHGHGSLRYVYKNGQVARSHLATIKYTSNPHRKHPRFAVVVSKKVHKGAVGRNRIRRRIYEIIRQRINEAKNYDVVIIISSSEALTMPANNLKDTLNSLLESTNLYK